MTYIDGQRLTQTTLQLDIESVRRGVYSDKYFANVVGVLEAASAAGYRYGGAYARPSIIDPHMLAIGDLVVEAQVFARRRPHVLVAGVDAALALLRHATGFYADAADTDGDHDIQRHFIDTSAHLEVEAVYDGMFAVYDGDPEQVSPVLKIRGRYRDFALLETPILGFLSRASRIATNTYEVLQVSNGKPVLFFPARFDHPAVQPLDGYAYWLAVQRYNHESGLQTTPSVSTDAQASWWGGRGGGTVPHALIAAFLADAAETMVAFARFMSPAIPRILLADFNNDVLTDARRTLATFWPHYAAAVQMGDTEGQQRWILRAVRLDTSPNLRDVSLPADAPSGVNPALVYALREALDTAWQSWDVPSPLIDTARRYCQQVRIAVTGGFNRDRIAEYEAAGVPVDIYGVGSSLLRNDSATNTDFTMDVVRVFVQGAWHDMAKVGRRPNDNADLHRVDLSAL